MPNWRNEMTPKEEEELARRAYAGEPPAISPSIPVPAKRLLTVNAVLEQEKGGAFV